MGIWVGADWKMNLEQLHVLVFGAGFSGRAIARVLANKGARVTGTNRTAEKAASLQESGVRPAIYDGEILPGLAAELQEITHLIVSIAPNEAGDPVLNDLRGAELPKLQSVIYLSTVGIYGDHDGAWVDESTECRPSSRRSRLRLAVEEQWQSFTDEMGVELTILRLSGIYGPGRNAFVNLQNGTAKRIVKPGQVFNRIHVEDIAGATAHLIGNDQAGIFNVSDNEPAPPQDVVEFAASLMGVEPPPEIPFDEAKMTPMARSFYDECKRVSNARLLGTGYKLIFPTYREAMESMWRDQRRERP